MDKLPHKRLYLLESLTYFRKVIESSLGVVYNNLFDNARKRFLFRK